MRKWWKAPCFMKFCMHRKWLYHGPSTDYKLQIHEPNVQCTSHLSAARFPSDEDQEALQHDRFRLYHGRAHAWEGYSSLKNQVRFACHILIYFDGLQLSDLGIFPCQWGNQRLPSNRHFCHLCQEESTGMRRGNRRNPGVNICLDKWEPPAKIVGNIEVVC